jgi:hypothetical protein
MVLRRLSFLVPLLVAGMGVVGLSARVDARPACFGGTPHVVAEHEHEPRDLSVDGRYLTWSAGAPRRSLDLATLTLRDDVPVELPPPPSSSAIDHGFVFSLGGIPKARGQPALLRRALGPKTMREEVVARLPLPRQRGIVRQTVLRVAGGRVYFVFDEAIWSAPVRGPATPTRLTELPRSGAFDLLVDGGCVYWATEHVIGRIAVDGGAPRTPQVIADQRSYEPTPVYQIGVHDGTGTRHAILATDGRHLYWPDNGNDRIVRVGRDARTAPPAPPLVTTSAGRAAVSDTPPPPGVTWELACGIHADCAQPAGSLPTCPAGVAGTPWAKLEEDADHLEGAPVSVSGPLLLTWRVRGSGYRSVYSGSLVGEHEQCHAGECCRTDPTRVQIGGGRNELELSTLECPGDDSRTCCPFPVLGQTVIASGKLRMLPTGNWLLTASKVCVPPARD